jgi:hypothetical protein
MASSINPGGLPRVSRPNTPARANRKRAVNALALPRMVNPTTGESQWFARAIKVNVPMRLKYSALPPSAVEGRRNAYRKRRPIQCRRMKGDAHAAAINT